MNESQPIFMQIMEIIETDILRGVYHADDLIISTTQISKLYSVNPATAVKAVSKLADEGILHKRRGIGMCVTPDALNIIRNRRKDTFIDQTLRSVLAEAETLGISMDELISMLRSERTDND